MDVLKLLDEIEELVDTAPGFPLTGKILVSSEELLDIVRDIRVELPDEIHQAQWIKDERQRILDEAKAEYEDILKKAQKQAEALIENDDITIKAKQRAEEIMAITETNCRELTLSAYEYVDRILYNFQTKMEELNQIYFGEMFTNLEKTFVDINDRLANNRAELKEMAIKAQTED